MQVCCEYVGDACVHCRNTAGMRVGGKYMADAFVYCRNKTGLHVQRIHKGCLCGLQKHIGMHACCEYTEEACVFCRSTKGTHVCCEYIRGMPVCIAGTQQERMCVGNT